MIFPWWVATGLGSLIAVFLNFYYYKIPISIQSILFTLPLMMGINIFYWYGFRQASSFIVVFLLMIIIPSILNLTFSIIYLKEILRIEHIIGICIITIGIYFLNMK